MRRYSGGGACVAQKASSDFQAGTTRQLQPADMSEIHDAARRAAELNEAAEPEEIAVTEAAK